MIFIHDNLKYDTDKMEKVIEYEEVVHNSDILGNEPKTVEIKVYRSKKGRWCMLYFLPGNQEPIWDTLTHSGAKKILMERDIDLCEKYFGKFKEA